MGGWSSHSAGSHHGNATEWGQLGHGGQGDAVGTPQIQGEVRIPRSTNTVEYRGVLGTLSTMVRTEGPRSLYSGLVAGLQRQMSFASIRIGLYDSVKQLYTPKGAESECSGGWDPTLVAHANLVCNHPQWTPTHPNGGPAHSTWDQSCQWGPTHSSGGPTHPSRD